MSDVTRILGAIGHRDLHTAAVLLPLVYAGLRCLAELVKLRFFAGLTMPEAAVALGLSVMRSSMPASLTAPGTGG
jgi:hypothetical protein